MIAEAVLTEDFLLVADDYRHVIYQLHPYNVTDHLIAIKVRRYVASATYFSSVYSSLLRVDCCKILLVYPYQQMCLHTFRCPRSIIRWR